MSPLDGFRTAVRDWMDADEITAEDLKGPLTAEEEVLDWMVETPVPRAPRPSWLPQQAAPRRVTWTPTPPPDRRAPAKRPSGSRLAWVAVGTAGAGVCALGGVAFAAVLVALGS